MLKRTSPLSNGAPSTLTVPLTCAVGADFTGASPQPELTTIATTDKTQSKHQRMSNSLMEKTSPAICRTGWKKPVKSIEASVWRGHDSIANAAQPLQKEQLRSLADGTRGCIPQEEAGNSRVIGAKGNVCPGVVIGSGAAAVGHSDLVDHVAGRRAVEGAIVAAILPCGRELAATIRSAHGPAMRPLTGNRKKPAENG